MWLYIPSSALPASECLESDCAPGLDTWASRLAPSVTLSGRLSPPASWRRAWPKAPWMTRLSGPTLPASTLTHGVEQWIASLAGSRAKTCPLQAAAQGWTESEAGCSSTSSELPKIAVRDTSFWRTSQASLLPPPPLWTRPKANSKSAQPPASWESWPTAGGVRNGSLFQRPTWAPAMGGRDGFAGRGETWLTPNVPNGGRSVSAELVASKGTTADGEKRTVGLESQAKYWATPTSSDNSNRTTQIAPSHGVTHGLVLAGQAASWSANSAATHSPNPAGATDVPTAKAMGWPTPRGTDGTKGGPNQAGSKGDLMLPSAAAQWPTPAARDSKGPNSEQHATVTGGGQETHGSVSQLRGAYDAGLFAPGPTDPRWAAILAAEPWRAPAIDKAAESLFCGTPDGLARGLDFSNRAARLKCCGNGVVPLQAAAAAVVLVRRMIGPSKSEPLSPRLSPGNAEVTGLGRNRSNDD